MFITFALVFLNFVAYFDLRTFFKQYFVQMEKKTKCFDLVLLVTYSSQQLANGTSSAQYLYSILSVLQ